MERMDHEHRRAPEPPSNARRRLFKVLCVALPVGGVLVLEVGLRAFGWGGHPPILQELGATSEGRLVVLEANSTKSYFFANRGVTGGNARFVFRMPKPPDTVRVFLFGGSAIMGFPQPQHLTPSAFLKIMLKDIWPERDIEVINFGATAVASFPVRDMVQHTLWADPDLVVIYSGHNEFYGAYGSASSNRAGSRPWMQVWHRRIQALALVQALRALTGRPGADQQADLMQVMVGQDHLPPGDWRREAATRTLTHNLRRMIRACQKQKVPVFICTLPSNERDLAPIGLEPVPIVGTRSPEELNRLVEATINEGGEACAQLESNLLDHIDSHSQSARAQYALGRLLLAQQQSQEAHSHFVLARDLDPMPWRATSQLQQAVREVTATEHAQLCEVEAVFRERSPGGSIGWELMNDHVHPTEHGQALIAEAVIRSMTNLPAPLHIDERDLERLRSWDAYAHGLGASQYDRYTAIRWMRIIFHLPFMKESNPRAYERFDALTSTFEQSQPEDIRSLLQNWDRRFPINVIVARRLIQQGRLDEALPLLRSAENDFPPDSAAHIESVHNELECIAQLHGHLEAVDQQRALTEIERGKFLVRCGVPDSWRIERRIGRLHLLREEYAQAIPHLLAAQPHLRGPNRLLDDRALIRAYSEIGEVSKARAIALDGVAFSGPYSKFYLDLLADLPAAATNDAKPPPPEL